MEVNGREVEFKKTTGAVCAIDKLAQKVGGMQNFLPEKMTGEEIEAKAENMAAFMAELSKGAEESKWYLAFNRGEDYIVRPLSAHEAMTLTAAEFIELYAEAINLWVTDTPTVNATGKKTAENPSA